jgi:hypothetical protein
MDAVISGRVGKALLLEGDLLRSFDVDDPGTLVPMQPSDYHLLFGDAPDIQFLEDTDASAVARALEFEHNCACALDVALISLDPELSTELRTEAVDTLEELLRDERVLARLENILYAEPLPPAADVRGAVACCEANRATTVRAMFEILEHHQQAIREVKLAWDAIPLRAFEDEDNREQFKHLVIHEGLFRSLVLARGSRPKVERFRADSPANPAVRKMRRAGEVLQQWVAPFLVKNNAPALTLEFEEDGQEPHSGRDGRKLGNAKRPEKLNVGAVGNTLGDGLSLLGSLLESRMLLLYSALESASQVLTGLVSLLIPILTIFLIIALIMFGLLEVPKSYSTHEGETPRDVTPR